MDEDYLTLTRASASRSSAQRSEDDYLEARAWMWSLAYGFHRDRTPTHGYEPTREAAMAAFAKSWRGRLSQRE